MRLDASQPLLHPEDQSAFHACLEQIFNASRENIAEFVGRFRQKSDQWLWMKIKLAVFERDDKENPVRMIVTAGDISAEMAVKESLQRRLQLLELTINSMSEGVIVCDVNGDLLLVNQSARQMLKTDSSLSSLSQVRAAYGDYHESIAISFVFQHRDKIHRC
jgi:PAS domain-containing protein